MSTVSAAPTARMGLLDRALRPFADVRGGEGVTALLLFSNLFLILVGYYVLKTVREPLILATGGAEAKAYAAAGQALVLMGFIPLYGWFSSRVGRMKLIVGVTLFFTACIELFYLGAQLRVPYLGVVFYIWVGIFSLAIIAQFWSYANDIYTQQRGDRLFALIAIGATGGSWAGSKVAELLFKAEVNPYAMMQIPAAILLLTLVLYAVVNGRETARRGQEGAALARGGGFALVFRSRYLMLIGLLLVLLNVVNTTGEYILSRTVVAAADMAVTQGRAHSKDAFIGSFYGEYFFYVNVAALLIQMFLVSRIVKYLGMTGALLSLPVVALGVYGFVAAGAALQAIRWAKTAENSTDYSVMNTARQMVWLPTSREEKYKAKQALDTFFVRAGDVLSAGIVFAGTHGLALDVRGFASGNILLVVAWLTLGVLVLREYRRLTAGPGSA